MFPSDERFLIVGLGNPGAAHRRERHNVGFRVIYTMAQTWECTLKPELTVQGEVAKTTRWEREVVLLCPFTWMNRSGESVRRAVMRYNVPLAHVLILCDDVALPLGEMRLRLKGSSGGHNGLKSVIERLATQEVPRCRLGVGSPTKGPLAEYVLSAFAQEEEPLVEKMTEKAQEVVQRWVSLDPEAAMRFANGRAMDKEKRNEKS